MDIWKSVKICPNTNMCLWKMNSNFTELIHIYFPSKTNQAFSIVALNKQFRYAKRFSVMIYPEHDLQTLCTNYFCGLRTLKGFEVKYIYSLHRENLLCEIKGICYRLLSEYWYLGTTKNLFFLVLNTLIIEISKLFLNKINMELKMVSTEKGKTPSNFRNYQLCTSLLVYVKLFHY